MRVAADREQLGGDRALAAPERDAADDGGDVGAERARVDELAGEEPLRDRSGRGPPRGRPSPGSTSVVVEPMSTRSASGTNRPTSMAVATQLEAAASSGRARAVAGSTNSPAVVKTRTGARDIVVDGVEHEAHALALGPEHVRQLRGHGHRDRVRGGELGGERAEDVRQGVLVPPDLERAARRAHGAAAGRDLDDGRLDVGAAHVPARAPDAPAHQASLLHDEA